MEKPVVKIEAGKVIVDSSLEYKVDKDSDGKASVHATSVNHIEIDSYELVSEIMKKDSMILEMVLKQMNYKPA